MCYAHAADYVADPFAVRVALLKDNEVKRLRTRHTYERASERVLSKNPPPAAGLCIIDVLLYLSTIAAAVRVHANNRCVRRAVPGGR